jgi:hypothetical protein
MRNPLLVLFKWLRYVLFEEIEVPNFPGSKRKKILHNAHLIQVWAVLTGIVSIGLIPICIWLFTVPGFVIAYLAWCAVMGLSNLVLRSYVRHLNEEDLHKVSKSGSDACYEYEGQ